MFNNLKLFRTYIDGSKKNEKKAINNLDEELINNIDNLFLWMRLEKLMIKQRNDVLHFLWSWKVILKNLTFFLISLSFLLTLFSSSKYVVFSPIIMSLFSVIAHKIITVRIDVWFNSCVLITSYVHDFINNPEKLKELRNEQTTT